MNFPTFFPGKFAPLNYTLTDLSAKTLAFVKLPLNRVELLQAYTREQFQNDSKTVGTTIVGNTAAATTAGDAAEFSANSAGGVGDDVRPPKGRMFFILLCEFFKLLLACHRHHGTVDVRCFPRQLRGEGTFTSSCRRRRRRLRCFSDVYKRDSSERRSKQLPGLGRAADPAHISLASALNCLNVLLFVSFCSPLSNSHLCFDVLRCSIVYVSSLFFRARLFLNDFPQFSRPFFPQCRDDPNFVKYRFYSTPTEQIVSSSMFPQIFLTAAGFPASLTWESSSIRQEFRVQP